MSDLIRSSLKIAMVAAIAAVAATVLTPPPAFAQALYGSIVGTVDDSSGAPVPGASVTIRNTATNFERVLQKEACDDGVAPGPHNVGR